MRVAVLGAGVMGAGMVMSLRRAGHDVSVWNRTAAKADALAPTGAIPAATVSEAVTGAGAVLTVLFDLDATLAVKPDLLAALGPDAVWIQVATVGPAGMAELASGASRIVDAPVLGTKKPAEDGTLTVLASGDPALLERVTPIFDAIGVRVIQAGDDLGTARAVKLVCNSWVSMVMSGVAQSIRFAQSLGVDPRLYLQAIDGGPVGAPYAQVKGNAILAGDWTTSFAVDGVVKDLDLMLAEAARTGFPPVLLETVRTLVAETSAAGLGDADMAAVAQAFTDADAESPGDVG